MPPRQRRASSPVSYTWFVTRYGFSTLLLMPPVAELAADFVTCLVAPRADRPIGCGVGGSHTLGYLEWLRAQPGDRQRHPMLVHRPSVNAERTRADLGAIDPDEARFITEIVDGAYVVFWRTNDQ